MSPAQIVDEMYTNDAFSLWLGIKRISIKEGYCKLEMTVRPEMTNGFGIAHGGISYSFADSAFAFASNSRGKKAVSIETSISHTAPVHAGDVITAEAKEDHVSNKIGIYHIDIVNQDGLTVGLFKGTVYRTSKDWNQTKK
jgi:acyl-CoA thioesterase